MHAFNESLDLLRDFLTEANDLLGDVDIKLVELERRPDDTALLNDIFRGFHTIKGGAGFLDATALVDLCHRTENLFDRLRAGKIVLQTAIMDRILAATAEVRRMFGEMSDGMQPAPAPASLLAALEAIAAGEEIPAPRAPAAQATPAAPAGAGPDWAAYYAAIAPQSSVAGAATGARAATERPQAERAPSAGRAAAPQRETTLRVDTARFDQILNLSGEIGLTKNRLVRLRRDLAAQVEGDGLNAMAGAIDALDMLVGDLQNAVMKARMQPVGRVFQKYIRQARDLARNLGKDVELKLDGEDTEVDKTILDELNDPLVHLVRNSVDHGVESPAERAAAGKPAKSLIQLAARQTGDQIVIEIIDDGRGMNPEVIRRKAVEKGLLSAEEAAVLDERQSLALIFLPGFSTKDAISDVSGRGVGMDVVKTNIQRLKGRIDIASEVGIGTRITIKLPLTLAILPVLLLRLGQQPYAIPLGAVREIIELNPQRIQSVSGVPHVVLRGEVLPVTPLAELLDRPQAPMPALGVVVSVLEQLVVLGVDGLEGQDEVMVKPIEGVKPKGVSGATVSGGGDLVLVLELHELLAERLETSSAQRLAA